MLRLVPFAVCILYLKLKKTEPSVALHHYHRLKSILLRIAHRFQFTPPLSLGSSIFLL